MRGPFASVFASENRASRSSSLFGGLLLRDQVDVEKTRGLGLGAGHQVPVAVQGDRDRGVAHERRQGLGVDAGSDHQGREGVPALVQRNAGELGSGPRLVRPLGQLLGAERLGRSGAEETL
jgi:hypothetical protein